MIYYNVNGRLYTRGEMDRLHKNLNDGIRIYTSSRNTYKKNGKGGTNQKRVYMLYYYNYID